MTHKRWMEGSLFGAVGLAISSYLIIYHSLTSAKGMTRSRTAQTVLGWLQGHLFPYVSVLERLAATQTWVLPWDRGLRGP